MDTYRDENGQAARDRRRRDRRRQRVLRRSPRSATTTRARSSRRRRCSTAAKDGGAHAVKLQKRDNRSLYTREYYNRPYDNENSFGATYGEHREALEFGRDEYLELQALRRRARHRLLRDRLRRRERRLPRRARHAGLQDRLGRPQEHAAAAPRRRGRQADGRSRPAPRRSRTCCAPTTTIAAINPQHRDPAVHGRLSRPSGRSSTSR